MNPAVLAMLVTAAIAAGQGAYQSTTNNGAQKDNKKQLDELLGRRESGDLGLGADQSKLLDHQLNVPVQAAAAAQQQHQEQLLAGGAAGAGSGADLARLRGEANATRAGGAQNAALVVAQMNDQARKQQLNEIEQRQALKSQYRRDDTNAIVGGAAAAAPALAGTLDQAQQSDMAGKFSQLSPDEQQQVLTYAKANPEGFGEIMHELLGESATQ